MARTAEKCGADGAVANRMVAAVCRCLILPLLLEGASRTHFRRRSGLKPAPRYSFSRASILRLEVNPLSRPRGFAGGVENLHHRHVDRKRRETRRSDFLSHDCREVG